MMSIYDDHSIIYMYIYMVIMNDDNVWRSYMLIIYDAHIYMVSIYVVMYGDRI
jgi:hypothetical protein